MCYDQKVNAEIGQLLLSSGFQLRPATLNHHYGSNTHAAMKYCQLKLLIVFHFVSGVF